MSATSGALMSFRKKPAFAEPLKSGLESTTAQATEAASIRSLRPAVMIRKSVFAVRIMFILEPV
jgi:predicted transcriptional regulator